jgi:hypothetical protein
LRAFRPELALDSYFEALTYLYEAPRAQLTLHFDAHMDGAAVGRLRQLVQRALPSATLSNSATMLQLTSPPLLEGRPTEIHCWVRRALELLSSHGTSATRIVLAVRGDRATLSDGADFYSVPPPADGRR